MSLGWWPHKYDSCRLQIFLIKSSQIWASTDQNGVCMIFAHCGRNKKNVFEATRCVEITLSYFVVNWVGWSSIILELNFPVRIYYCGNTIFVWKVYSTFVTLRMYYYHTKPQHKFYLRLKILKCNLTQYHILPTQSVMFYVNRITTKKTRRIRQSFPV